MKRREFCHQMRSNYTLWNASRPWRSLKPELEMRSAESVYFITAEHSSYNSSQSSAAHSVSTGRDQSDTWFTVHGDNTSELK
jgi:hypothetical protein